MKLELFQQNSVLTCLPSDRHGICVQSQQVGSQWGLIGQLFVSLLALGDDGAGVRSGGHELLTLPVQHRAPLAPEGLGHPAQEVSPAALLLVPNVTVPETQENV